MARTKLALQAKNNKEPAPGAVDDGKKAITAGVPPAVGAAKRKHRWRPGTVALREIRQLQKGTGNVLPLAGVNRMARALLKEIKPEFRFSPRAIKALREMVQDKGTELMREGMEVAAARGGQTLTAPDMMVAEKLNTAHQARYSVGGGV